MSAGTGVASVYREAWAVYRAHPIALLAPGVVLFLAFGLPSALLSHAELEATQRVDVILLVVAVQTLGFVSSFLYYGYCEKVAAQARLGSEVSVRKALSDTWHVLPMLIAGSIVAEFLVVLGFALLILPGVYLAYRYAIVAPAASFEHAWPRRAMGRSRDLVRGHFRFVLVTAVAMFVAEQILSSTFDTLGADIAANETVGGVLGDAVGDLLIGPFAGLVTAIVYFRLSGRGEGAMVGAAGGEGAGA